MGAMFDSLLRPLKDRLLHPIALLLLPVSPTALTFVSFVFGLAAIVLAGYACFAPALACWLGNRFFDGLDGAVARLGKKTSDFGGYLDILADFVVYAGLPLGILAGLGAWQAESGYGFPGAWPAVGTMLALFYVNGASWIYLSALIEKRRAGGQENHPKQTSIAMPRGIAEGFETILIYSLMLVLPERVEMFAWILAVLVVPNLFLRIAAARNLARG